MPRTESPSTTACGSFSTLPDHVKPATLKVISLHSLESGSKAEASLLLEAAATDGFFYLDLSHSSYREVLESADAVFHLSSAIFSHDEGTKNLFDVDKISKMKTNGYKPKGRNIVSKDGARDGFESWALPRNGLLQLTTESFPHTPSVAAHIQSLRSLLNGLGSAAQTIFKSLSTNFSLRPGERFEDFHNPSHPSSDMLRLLKYHKTEVVRDGAAPPQTPHTDLGSLTFVFSTTPGLQVLPHNSGVGQQKKAPEESDWVYVEPRAHCAVVNFGDCMSMLTDGLIKSSLHRVGPLPGLAMPERYSFAYLMRPEDDTPLKTVNSPLISTGLISPRIQIETLTSGEWIARKFQALRGSKAVAKEGEKENGARNSTDEVLTGGRAIMV